MTLRRAIAAAAILGVAIAAYLTYVHYANVSPICSSGGCERVQTSSYAELAGVPVALLGLLAYLAILGTTAVRGVAASFAGVLLAVVGRHSAATCSGHSSARSARSVSGASGTTSSSRSLRFSVWHAC